MLTSAPVAEKQWWIRTVGTVALGVKKNVFFENVLNEVKSY